MIELNDYYEDRGIVKYNGFYLSEHTADINTASIERNKVIAGRDQMSMELIFEIVDFAIYKNKRISIQLGCVAKFQKINRLAHFLLMAYAVFNKFSISSYGEKSKRLISLRLSLYNAETTSIPLIVAAAV